MVNGGGAKEVLGKASRAWDRCGVYPRDLSWDLVDVRWKAPRGHLEAQIGAGSQRCPGARRAYSIIVFTSPNQL